MKYQPTTVERRVNGRFQIMQGGIKDTMFPLFVFFVLNVFGICRANEGPAARYSYSLTTFDPSGKLGQVERAAQAAAQGVPILAVTTKDAAYFAAPQLLPSSLVIDDGTPRFIKITPEIMIGHTGLTADGRILMDAASKIAVQHEYTFDEQVGIETFLEEIALLIQENTMKAGTRPFGCTLVVAYVPTAERQLTEGHMIPCLYRIDPSGSVQLICDACVINGRLKEDQVRSALVDLSGKGLSGEEMTISLTRVLQNELEEQSKRVKRSSEEAPVTLKLVSARLKREGDFSLQFEK